MAYTRTITFTRPSTDVEIPKVSDSYPDVDTVSRTTWAEAGISKTYTWDVDELVLTVQVEGADKAAIDSVVSDLYDVPSYGASKSTIIAACEAAGITGEVTDSDGATLLSF